MQAGSEPFAHVTSQECKVNSSEENAAMVFACDLVGFWRLKACLSLRNHPAVQQCASLFVQSGSCVCFQAILPWYEFGR